MLAAYLVLLLAIYLLCLLTSSWASRSTSASAVDMLAVQWYWTAATADVNNSTTIDIGSAWSIDVSTTVTAPTEGVTLIATALDVLHSLYLPSILLRADVIPSRLTILIALSEAHGLLAGQCSELCGPLHGFMAYSVCIAQSMYLVLPTYRTLAVITTHISVVCVGVYVTDSVTWTPTQTTEVKVVMTTKCSMPPHTTRYIYQYSHYIHYVHYYLHTVLYIKCTTTCHSLYTHWLLYAIDILGTHMLV